MTRGHCPSADVLSRYAAGQLSEAEAETLHAHLGTCADCLADLDDLACRTDPLLAALRRPCPPAAQTSSRLTRAVASVLGPALLPPGPMPGALLSGYRLVEEIGLGGMGRVYRARHPRLEQEVALKVLRPGMDSAPILARFEAERQALALMDHPNIARVFDGGVTEDGRPFFVMELVQGVALTRYCDEHRLDLRRRLELFGDICQAVQHAHQKGVIHRDLKPSNVLVTEYDGRPVPKVIDFGVAKALERRSATQTEVGMLIGTPQYMSPEQADLTSNDIDTRSDIYALGVLLYELLTGDTPIARGRLRQMPVLEVLRLVREEEPPRPSARLSAAETQVEGPTRPGIDPVRLARQVRGELDWIAMKALDKERSRRYETANALALDVGRYLRDEQVLACPPSLAYRFRKFVRRNQWAVLAAAVVMITLVGGATVSTWQASRAAAAATNERAAKEAEAVQRRQAEAVAGVMVSAFEGLNPFSPDGDIKGQLVSRLAAVATGLEKEYAGEPLVRARLRVALARTQLGLGEPAKAVTLLEQARAERLEYLGPDHPDTLECLDLLGNAWYHANQWPKALSFLEQALEGRKAQLGPDHPDTLTSMINLASVQWSLGRRDEALALYKESLRRCEAQLGKDHVLTHKTKNGLANAYLHGGDFGEGVGLLEQVLDWRSAHLGPDHPSTLVTLSNLAFTYQQAGQLDRAAAMMERVLEGRRTRLGPNHPRTLDALGKLAQVSFLLGRHDRAAELYREQFERLRKTSGPKERSTMVALSSFGHCRLEQHRYAEAETAFRQTLAVFAQQWPDDVWTDLTRYRLGAALLGQKRYAEAEPLLLSSYQGLARREARPGGATESRLREALEALVGLYEAWEKPDEAAKWRAKLPPAKKPGKSSP